MHSLSNTLKYITALLIAAVSCADAQWNWSSPRPQGNTLLKVQFVDTSLGWAVGEYGTIVHTTNGGLSWYSQLYGQTDNVLSIAMVSDTMGWAVGDNGSILHSTDGGDTWDDQSGGVSVGLNTVAFLNADEGWAAGDNEVIIHTTDGGASWALQHQNNSPPVSVNAIAFPESAVGWGVGSSRSVFHTTDNGTTWTKQAIGAVSSTYLSVSFVTPTLGFITGTGGVILRTDDGGTNWAPVSSGIGQNLNDLRMQNTFVGWIAADAGYFLKTINGGLSWSSVIVGEGENFNGLTRAGNKLWMAGEFGKIFRSTNSGTAWNAIDAGSRLSANWIDAPTDSIVCAVGQTGLIMRTTNAGGSWVQQSSPSPSTSCYGVKFTDPNQGWAVGDNGLIVRTTDGGTWISQASPTSASLLGITFASPSEGWIVGGNYGTFLGTIVRSTDAGSSWSVQTSSAAHILYGVAFPTPADGWVVGEQGLILHTTDHGSSWATQTSGTSAALFWCAFRDNTHGWAVGDSGKILYTTNGGASWSKQNSGVSSFLFSVITRGASRATVVGDNGVILSTTNSGSSWSIEYSRTQYGLYSVAQQTGASLWTAGDYGTVLNKAEFVVTTGSISGRVVNDLNNNSIADPAEPGLPGWTVSITGTQSKSTVSGPGGAFVFNSLPFGPYTVSISASAGWTQTLPSFPGTHNVSVQSLAPDVSVEFGAHTASASAIVASSGWSLISIPIIPPDGNTKSMFPSSTSFAFSFQGTYQRVDSLHHGGGYWLKFPAQETLFVAGTPVLADTVPVTPGWNLVGSSYDTIPIASMATDPPGLILSSMYAYHGSYLRSDYVIPGEGYWLKFAATGSLILNAPPGMSGSSAHVGSEPFGIPNLNELRIQDASGKSAILRFGKSSAENDGWKPDELPPLPPAGSFDARFSNGANAVLLTDNLLTGSDGTIRVQSSSYPVRLSWARVQGEGVGFVIKDRSKIIASMADSGSLSVDESLASRLSIAATSTGAGTAFPREFALYQNTPNPFNPTTLIRYDLPARSRIRMTVYDLLGQEVQVLTDDVLDAGFHQAVWNPSGASGIYFCRLEATEMDGSHRQFVESKKMIYLK